MSEHYQFSTSRPAFSNAVIDESIQWQPEEVSNIDYSVDGANSVIADSINESYVTAVGDNTTQYLSVLDGTSDMTLENLDTTLSTPKENNQVLDSVDDQQMVLFTLEGSDEFYGIQLAQDEEGNVRKYQFQLRQTENGQYEAIPETIQIIQDEPEAQTNLEEVYNLNENKDEKNAEEEHILPHDISELNENHNEEITIMYNNEIDNKSDLIDGIKKEKLNSTHLQVENEEYLNEYEEPVTKQEENYLHQEEMVEAVVQKIEENIDTNDVEEDNPNYFHVVNSGAENYNNIEESDDTDEYNIIDGLPITGDAEHLEPVKTNVLKETLKMKDIKGKKDKLLYLIVQPSEKENVNSLSFDTDDNDKSVKRINPRSILKSSHSIIECNNESLKNKRFSRGKEAMEARLFHSFINKTTIPQAPIRKDRLPRKQKIKQIERTDEEIIVKEVIITNNSFIDSNQNCESLDNDEENDLEVTAYVELTDSDEDYHPRKDKRKRKKMRKRVQIEISDEDNESDDSVIDLDHSDNEENKDECKDKDDVKTESKNEEKMPMKRRRGRPPKQKSTDDDNNDNEKLESPLKKIRLDSTNSNNDNNKKVEISCPKCPKTFPSQNSLKTHLQHHNLESTILLRSRSAALLNETKYKCEDCEENFKNSVLLKRHNCTKQFDCTICKKKFTDMYSLNLHKRTHAKTQLIKSTTVPVKVSPKKIMKQATFKLPPKKSTNIKCKVCNKVCSSTVNLNIHLKTHFKCLNCSDSFISRIMLENHVRESCVKPPNNRRSLRISSQSNSNETKMTNLALKLNCESCSMQFKTYNALFAHQVTEHGLSTPDKSLIDKNQTSVKKKKTYGGGGIRAQRIGGAFANLRSKQLEFGNKSE